MSLLNKLPGFQRSPPGLEWVVLKRLPTVLAAGTVIPAIFYMVAHWLPLPADAISAEKYLHDVAILAIAIVTTLWTAVFTVAIGCCIVVLMKGPAYVADPYPLSDSEQPPSEDRQPRQHRAGER